MKGDIRLTNMTITLKWETGDNYQIYSPKASACQSRFKKWIGWKLVCIGGMIFFGKEGWKLYQNEAIVDVNYESK